MLLKEKIWDIVEVDVNKAKCLAEELGVSYLVTSILLGRGLDSTEAVREFLFGKAQPFYDPFLMQDMDKACERIEKALANGEKITVFGDYDVDGMTATSVLWKYFQHRNAKADYYIPRRKNEGYGLNVEALKTIAQSGTSLLITVDCGISNYKEVATRPEGLDIIVTDHHTVPDILPKAVAVVDPHRKDCQYPFKELSGVGVAFKLCQALEKRQGREWTEDLDLVTVGTVADIVSLKNENREIVRCGLQLLSENCSLGLKEMIKHIALDGKKITSDNIAFMLAPRLNAAGRLGDAKDAVELLTTSDVLRAQELATLLDSENFERQQISNDILQEAEQMLAAQGHIDTAIVLRSDKWHAGVVGIVASRLVDKYHLPTILFSEADGILKGSCRSIEPLNIYDAVSAGKQYLIQFGGHKQAAGLTLKAEDFEAFKNDFCEYIRSHLQLADFRSRQHIDLVLRDEGITVRDVKNLALLEPYGCDNPVPVFAYRNAQIKNYRIIGARENHLMFDVSRGDFSYRGIMWNKAEVADVLDSNGTAADIVFQPKLNEWNNEISVQLHILTFSQHPAVYDLRRSCGDKIAFLKNILKTESAVALFTNQDKIEFGKFLQSQLGDNSRYVHIFNYDEDFSADGGIVVCYDLPLVNLLDFMKKVRTSEISTLVLLFNGGDFSRFMQNHPDVNAMRKAYLSLKNHFDKHGTFDYKKFLQQHLDMSENMIKILAELQLLKLTGTSIQEVVFKKVDIGTSVLFGSLYGQRQKWEQIFRNNVSISRYELLRV